MRRMWMAALSSLLLVTGAGCSARQRVNAEKTLARAVISDEQEAQLGKQVKAELEQKEKVRYVQDPEIVTYVNRVAGPVLQVANRDRRVAWKVSVIDDPKTVNAFATPGGYLYVYTGLLLAASNDAEVAGVMGHEAGHVVERHSARAMVNAYGLQAVLQMALGKNPNLAAQVASTLAAQGALLAHGRSEETEADEAGARYTHAAGVTPRGLVSFFEKLQKEQGNVPGVLAFLSTHPNPGDRVKHLHQYIATQRLTATGGGEASQLNAVKQRIRALPAAAR
jgi:beta-barrel assembly-enhancing protease